MRSFAAALAWEFARRNRWGPVALVCYLLVLALFRFFITGPGDHATGDTDWGFAFGVVVPAATTFMFFVAIFSFGLEGDLSGRQSIFPARMFTLPVTSSALAGWPMLYGTVAMASLWLATRLLGVWPAELEVPWIWPGVLAVAILAWTQALNWMPYALTGMRVVVTVLLMTSINIVVLLALHTGASEVVMVALLAPHLPLAYLTARLAVTRARRGEVPEPRRVFAHLRAGGNRLPTPRASFDSAAGAQMWFEWRHYGRSLPAIVAILLPFELSLVLVLSETPASVLTTLLGVLLTPPFLASFVAAAVSKSSRGEPARATRSPSGLTPFIATRPLTNTTLIVAKLKGAFASALVTWLLVLLAIAFTLTLSDTWSVIADAADRVAQIVGTPRATAIALLSLLAFIGATWKQLVQSLFIGMTGRPWLIRGSILVALSLLTLTVSLIPWAIGNVREVIATLWNTIPWILAVAACLKIAISAWIAKRLQDQRLLSDRVLVKAAACWCVAVLVLYGLLSWLTPAVLFRGYVLVLIAILAVPLARISAAPLALSWNRHR